MEIKGKLQKYILENHYDKLAELRGQALGDTAIAKMLIKEDDFLKDMKFRNLRRVIERIFKDFKRIDKVMVYDIETSRGLAEVWSTGKTYISHTQMRTETAIVTVAWKWLGSNEIKVLKWEADGSEVGGNDKELMEEFLKEYNKADMVIGWNNNNFDNKLINTRALKHRLEVNTLVKSFDLMVKAKRVFRQPSNALAYYARFLGLGGKLQHFGLKTWQQIQWGAEEDSKEAMDMMIRYNIQDVALTEEIYHILRPYLSSVMHFGTYNGGSKCSCPNCATEDTKLQRTTVTEAGTIQRIFECNSCNVKFKVSNTAYLKSL